MYPYTTEGKVMGTITILVGLVMLALPLSILGTNFVEERMKMIEQNQAEAQEPELPALDVIAELESILGNTTELYQMVATLKQKVEAAQEAFNSLNEAKENY